MSERLTNWAGNVTFTAGHCYRPSSVEELQALVAGRDRLRTLGTGHSFNGLADSTGDLLSVAGLPPIMQLDPDGPTVTVAGGVRYGQLAPSLHDLGYALPNLASLPHISVAGACATATHGSGNDLGNLATAVSRIEMVTADGELVVLTRESDHFGGAVVGLGALGVVTSLTLDVVPAFDVRQYVYDDLPRLARQRDFGEIFSSGYSVSVFTDWQRAGGNQVWVKRRVDANDPWTPEPSWLGATAADGPRHPAPGMPAVNCTEQLGVAGPWYQRLPHFLLEFTPSSGEELQSEYLLPRQHAAEALAAIDAIGDRLAPVLQISEIRTVAADDLWMSPCYQRDTVAIHFTWIKDLAAVEPVIAAVEDQLAPLRARPHWGKLFGTSPEVIDDLYPRLADFERLLHRYDPSGKFRNPFIDRYFPGQGQRAQLRGWLSSHAHGGPAVGPLPQERSACSRRRQNGPCALV
jgi:alditol oxidase